MPSSGMLRHVALVSSIIKVTRMGDVIFLHPVARSITQFLSSVFVRRLIVYLTLKYLKFTTCFGLKDHLQALKLWIEEVAVLAFFLGFISHICLFYCSVLCICRGVGVSTSRSRRVGRSVR
jgi:hypothetical protein